MTFILISGKTNTGKTQVCERLHDLIEQDPTYATLGGWNIKRPHFVDFIAHYEKNDKYIVLNSISDNDNCMKRLANYLDSLAHQDVRPDILITTIRETDVNNCQMSRMLALLEAIADGTQNLESHFTQNIENAASFAPASLGHHAFVLHLEKQGSTNAASLGRYWNASAGKVYDLLNFAIMHLSPRQAR